MRKHKSEVLKLQHVDTQFKHFQYRVHIHRLHTYSTQQTPSREANRF